MKKVIPMENLDCAHCALKMEEAIKRIDGVKSCTVNFMLQRMILETEEGCFKQVLGQAKKAVRRVNPSTELKL